MGTIDQMINDLNAEGVEIGGQTTAGEIITQLKLLKALIEIDKKTAWHDLRRNPIDLPDSERGVIVCTEYSLHTMANYIRGQWRGRFEEKVIAWKEIEMFEVGGFKRMTQKREFGSGKNEFRVEVNCNNGTDCLAGTKQITLRMNGCHCDATTLLARALEEFEIKHKELFEEAVNKPYGKNFSKEFWEDLNE